MKEIIERISVMESNMNKKIDEARKEAERVLSEAQAEADRSYTEIITAAKQKAHRLMQETKKEAEQEKERLIEEASQAQTHSSVFSSPAAEKIIHEKIITALTGIPWEDK